eukprot:CAMPEP_0194511194 /NCGR_PEP_ID=MMETSP0253-20130528/42794_1 /TAXON_ID=2966 /ORGANISM="Noctiluca scintillans" /LENGTH=190 /DNA_ID=CAMNT_0039354507 /DNA_START=47 /DNA_END=619 /DNA_ORIENTATION=-
MAEVLQDQERRASSAVADAMVNDLKTDQRCVLDAAGPGAISTALMSMVYATEFLEMREWSTVTLLAAPETCGCPEFPSFTRLHVQKVPPLPPANILTRPVKSECNKGKVAGAIAKIIRQNDVIDMVCVGPEPINKAVQAIILAQKFLDPEVSPDDRRLAFAVYCDESEVSSGEQDHPHTSFEVCHSAKDT